MKQTEQDVTIEIPAAGFKPLDRIVKLELDRDALAIAPIETPKK